MNNKDDNKGVSIIMSVFNEEQDLKETIQSVLNQTYKNFEFIIINDKSTDNTQEILEKVAKNDKRIKLIENEINLGLTKSLNKGIDASAYNLTARIDAGDKWDSGKLKKQVNFLEQNSEYVIIGTNTIAYNVQTNEERKVFLPEKDSEIRKKMLISSPMVHPSILFLKNAAKRYDETFQTGQDYNLYAEILQTGKAYNIQEFLTYIRTHQNKSISLNKWKQQKIARLKIRYKLFRQNKVRVLNYGRLIPDLLFLIIPNKAKLWKNTVFSFFKSNC